MCSCEDCIVGKLVNCRFEKAVQKFSIKDKRDDNSEDESGSESESEDAVYEAVEIKSTVAIYSPANVSELFYLCEIAVEDVFNEFNHTVSASSPFLKCRYLEKLGEKKGGISYKRVKGITYVLPYQLFLPSVEISEDLTIGSGQYIDLICMI